MSARLLLLLFAATLFPLNITFQEKPSTYQLYPRSEADMGTIRIKGTLHDAGFDSLSVAVTRNNRPFSRAALPAVYQADSVSFDFQVPFPAELAEYGVRFYADTVLALAADSLVAGDAYAITGQSNSITFIVGDVHEFIRTYTTKWKIAEQGRQYENGPEVGMWGQELGFHINQEQGLPVFIVNGGQPSLGIDFFTPGNSGYTDIMNRTTVTGLRNHLKAVFWYQGEANSTETGIVGYETRFGQLVQGWTTDYPALQKVYVCQLGIWGDGAAGNWSRNMRELQRNFPNTYAKVRAMATLGSPEPSGHWGAGGYRSIGDKLYRLVARDIYQSSDTVAIAPPNLLRAWYSSAAKDRITLLFDQPTLWKDSLGHKLADYIALDSTYKQVDSGWNELEYNRIILKLKSASSASKISLLTGSTYWTDDRTGEEVSYPTYRGPYLFNPRRVGALVFNDVPIETPLYTDTSLATGLTLTAAKSELLRFESTPMYAAFAYGSGLKDTNRYVSFTSLDPFVAQVNSKGVVRGFNPGTGRIRASRDGESDTLSVTILPEFAPLLSLEFTARTLSCRTLLQGDSMPIGVAALMVENNDTLRFCMDTLATVYAPSPYLQIKGNFIYAMQGGDSLTVTAELSTLHCSTLLKVVPAPSFIRRINFQATNAPMTSIPGWILDSGSPYSEVRGVGWVNSTVSGSSVPSEPNYFRQTMVASPRNNIEQTFRIDAPAGKYRIRLRNFNAFFGNVCDGSSWVRYGADTLLMNRLCNYQWDYDAQVTCDITISGDTGLVLNIYGSICYLILAADDGTDFDLIAKDEAGIVYPPPLTTGAEEDSATAAGLSETPAACPNPFNPATVVRFKLPAKVSADYGIYNIRGQRLAVFHLASLGTAREARIAFGSRSTVPLSSGLYYGRLVRNDGKVFSHRLLLVK